MIRDPRCHSGGFLYRLVNAAKVVIRKVKRQGGFQVAPFLTEGIRQAGEPLAPLAQRSILTFDPCDRPQPVSGLAGCHAQRGR
jgi:hypothetical protein